MLWFYLAFLAVILYAIGNVIAKYAITEYIKKPLFNTIITGIVTLLIALVSLLFSRIQFPNIELISIGLLAGFLFFIANWLFFKGILAEEISRALPIVLSMGPLFVLIIATVFLGEFLFPRQYVGIGLLFISSILISVKKTTKIKISVAFWSMTLSALFYAIQESTMKYLLSYMDFWNVFFWMAMGSILTSVGIMTFYHRTFFETFHKYKRATLYSSVSEVVGSTGTFVYTAAMSFGFISLVSSVQYTQSAFILVFATILSIYRPRIIREELKSSVLAVKILAIGIMIAGAFLIA